MSYIRTASFGGLFMVTFLVAASFQVFFSVLGLLFAFLSPGLFNMNGAPAETPVAAVGVVLFLLIFGLVMNAAVSSIGALIVMGWRALLPKPSQT